MIIEWIAPQKPPTKRIKYRKCKMHQNSISCLQEKCKRHFIGHELWEICAQLFSQVQVLGEWGVTPTNSPDEKIVQIKMLLQRQGYQTKTSLQKPLKNLASSSKSHACAEPIHAEHF